MGVKANESRAGLLYLWHNVAPRQRRKLYLVMLLMLAGAAAELLTIGSVLPFLALVSGSEEAIRLPFIGAIANALERWSGGNPVPLAALLLVSMVAFASAVRLMLSWTTLTAVLAIGHDLGAAVFGRMLRQPYALYTTRNSSEVLAGVQKIQALIWSLLVPAMQGVIAAVTAVAIVILLLAIAPLTASVAALIIAVPYLAVSLAVQRPLRRNSQRIARDAGRRIQTIREALGGMRDIVLDQAQDVFEAKYRKIDLPYRRAQAVNRFIGSAPRYVVEATGVALIAAVAVYVSGQPGGVLAAIPVLGTLAVGTQRLLPLLQQAYLGWSSTAGNRKMLLDVVDLMQAPVVAEVKRDRRQRPICFHDSIELERVSFQYFDRDYALRDVSLSIRKGSAVGFVGETGSGKSTLLDIIMGLLEPSTGSIRVDGQPLDDSSRANWQAQIGHVPQSIFLSDSSIMSNIAFGVAEADVDRARLRRAAEMAKIHDFIEQLRERYDTRVGERGIRLSGGQRQRIGIARAFYKQPTVLVLDEATNALDEATEAEIIDAVFASGEMTVLVVAHRTSTLKGCDQIVRLSNGRIVEVGSYEKIIVSSKVAAG